MTDVLIRGVPPEDLERIRTAAAEQGVSLQNYLLATVQGQASYVRRQEALAIVGQRLQDRPEVSADDREAVLNAIDAAEADREDQLSDPSR